ncbi:MAG: hypothetical protein LUC30_04180 [Clostridiales bacterium]|nr:hypothetical protein [Clostridiales bacterium]
MSSRVREENRSGRRVRPSGSSRSEKVRKRDRTAGRFLRQLGAALLIFALWMGVRQALPEQATVWADTLDRLLTGTADLREAFAQLGEDLSRGEGVAVAVGNWCETVFLPKDAGETEEMDEADVLPEAQLEDGGTA